MYLLIPVQVVIDTAPVNNLHSIMYLLILELHTNPDGTTWNLHSIMYLLILNNQLARVSASLTYLHSIMYLLIHDNKLLKMAQSILFTFHNVSINSHVCG